MTADIKIGDRVRVFLNAKVWGQDSWFNGTVVRIDPYTPHRSFYWVELDEDPTRLAAMKSRLISVLNLKNIQKL